MAKFWRGLLGRDSVSRYSIDQYAADLAFTFQGAQYAVGYGQTSYMRTEDIENSFSGYVNAAYKANGPIFAVILARMLLFTEGRFCWYEVNDDGADGRPAGRAGLEVLERPWPNGGTAELLARMEQDVSLGGNFYAVREPGRLRRLRPDWVTIVLTAPPAEAVESDVAGYWYHPGRSWLVATEPTASDEVYLPHEVAHWSPIPDPDAQYRGMSWVTPVLGEIMADRSATLHKKRFFDNGATFGAIISAKENLTEEQFKEWMGNLQAAHAGVDNAYKPLYLGSPVDVNTTTADMRQLDFKITQGAGETRLCAAGGVPPIIVGLSEGLASATYSNYGMARRKFGDHWAIPQWKSAAHALEPVVDDPPRAGLRLGVNTSDIAFLREDQKDAADIQQIKATTIKSYIDAGFMPDSVVAAVDADDRTLLKHTGLYSVQLLPPTSVEHLPLRQAESGLSKEVAAPPAEQAAAEAASAAEMGRAVTPDGVEGAARLHEYWTRGEGLAKWADSPHPWTTLRDHLLKYLPPGEAERTAAEWFHDVFHFWPGADLNRVTHGEPPRGHRIGPG